MEVPGSEQGRRSEFLLDKGAILVGLYAFTVALSLGFVILDQIYAYLINNQIASADSAFMFSEVSDFLLQFGFLSTLIAIGAIYVVWKQKTVRHLFLAKVQDLDFDIVIQGHGDDGVKADLAFFLDFLRALEAGLQALGGRREGLLPGRGQS